MSPGPKLSAVPGSAAFDLLTTRFRMTVGDRCSPWFTAVLVHGWYMRLLRGRITEREETCEVGARRAGSIS